MTRPDRIAGDRRGYCWRRTGHPLPGTTDGTHFVEGYVNPFHLAPAFAGAALFARSIAVEVLGRRALVES